MIPSRLGALAAVFVAVSAPALAHVSFENGQANPNSTYKATLRIPHGCAGKPTQKVRVRIPEGIVAVKPMPKAGWQLETAKGAYVKAYQVNGEAVKMNQAAFLWGRRAAVDSAAIDRLIAPKQPVETSTQLSQTVDEVIQRRVEFLTAYQNAAYANRYRTLVDEVRRAATEPVGGAGERPAPRQPRPTPRAVSGRTGPSSS